MTTTTVSNTTELNSALSTAVGGDLILMNPGSYGQVTINNVFTSEVRIRAANIGSPPQITDLNMTNAEFVGFEYMDFFWGFDPETNSNTVPIISISGVDNIRFTDCLVHGIIAFNAAQGAEIEYGRGFNIVGASSNVTIDHCEIHTLSQAISAGNGGSFLTISNNYIHNGSIDHIIMTDMQTVLIELNHIQLLKEFAPSHADMLQVASSDTVPSLDNMTIRKNFFDSHSASGSAVHTIFARNLRYELSQAAADRYDGWVIEDNVIFGNHLHGINMGEASNLTVQRNTLLYDVFAADPGSVPSIEIGEDTTVTLVDDNVAEGAVAVGAGTTGTINANYLVQRTDSEAAGYYGTDLVNALVQNPTIDGLQPKPGGGIATAGAGANLTPADLANVGIRKVFGGSSPGARARAGHTGRWRMR